MGEVIKTIMRPGDTLIKGQSVSKPKPVDMRTYYKCEELKERLAKGTVQEFESELCRRVFKILVVDDERDIAELIAVQLQKSGFPNIDIAYTGEDAVKRANDRNYDLVVSDYKLGDISGQKVFAELQSLSKIPSFVMISGYNDEQLQVLRDCGILVLPKPFNGANLVKIVEAVYFKKLKVLAESTQTILDLIKADDQKLILSSLIEGSSEKK